MPVDSLVWLRIGGMCEFPELGVVMTPHRQQLSDHIILVFKYVIAITLYYLLINHHIRL
jgi:hypothetical protein